MYITTKYNSWSIRKVKIFSFNKINVNFYLISHAFIFILDKQHCVNQYKKEYSMFLYSELNLFKNMFVYT